MYNGQCIVDYKAQTVITCWIRRKLNHNNLSGGYFVCSSFSFFLVFGKDKPASSFNLQCSSSSVPLPPSQSVLPLRSVSPSPVALGLPVKATSVSPEVYLVKSGEVFDGSMKTYDRSDITCLGQTETNGSSTAVFEVEPGATLKNVIIGTNQMEGVHCEMSDCTIENVWWEDVCEDALSIKGGNASSVSRVIGGGARYAEDKVIQHNGYGTVVVDGFFAQDFGKLYRSCGNCKSNPRQRFLNMSNIYADLEVIHSGRTGKNVSIVMMNGNFGDQAVLRNIYVKPTTGNFTECASSYGVNQSGVKPVVMSSGPKFPVCQYSYDDVHLIQTEKDQPNQYEQEQQQPTGKLCVF